MHGTTLFFVRGLLNTLDFKRLENMNNNELCCTLYEITLLRFNPVLDLLNFPCTDSESRDKKVYTYFANNFII